MLHLFLLLLRRFRLRQSDGSLIWECRCRRWRLSNNCKEGLHHLMRWLCFVIRPVGQELKLSGCGGRMPLFVVSLLLWGIIFPPWKLTLEESRPMLLLRTFVWAVSFSCFAYRYSRVSSSLCHQPWAHLEGYYGYLWRWLGSNLALLQTVMFDFFRFFFLLDFLFGYFSLASKRYRFVLLCFLLFFVPSSLLLDPVLRDNCRFQSRKNVHLQSRHKCSSYSWLMELSLNIIFYIYKGRWWFQVEFRIKSEREDPFLQISRMYFLVRYFLRFFSKIVVFLKEFCVVRYC